MERITISADADIVNRIDAASGAAGLSRSAWIAEMLQKVLDNELSTPSASVVAECERLRTENTMLNKILTEKQSAIKNLELDKTWLQGQMALMNQQRLLPGPHVSVWQRFCRFFHTEEKPTT